ncbi:hypothetical protein BDZ91DRAFT_791623 [Kalaharituber pfeilii]|nr:hypothetical protein BDZ91DRAFT_791623 [Kalaharituber pfeilii]
MDNSSQTQSNSNLSVNRERTHNRTLSVPSISTTEHHFTARSPSPAPSTASVKPEGSPFSNNNMYLTPNADNSSQWGARPGTSGGGVRSRSASTSSLSAPTVGQPGAPVKKKVVTACQRCRTRKIKCDGVLPCCGNCAKAGQICMEVDKSGERDIPRSHVLELENRVKYLEDLLSTHCPNIDLATSGPPVELRTRPTPPSIRIVTSGPNLHPPASSSIASSSPISAVSTAVSFDFSPGGSLLPPYSPAFSPCSFSEPAGSGMPSPMLSPASSPFLNSDYGMGGFPHQSTGEMGRKGSVSGVRTDQSNAYGNSIAQDVGLVALSLTEDASRYIGPSSGCDFARMMFADCPSIDSGSLAPTNNHNGEEDNKAHRRRSSGSINSGCPSSNSSSKGEGGSGSVTPSASATLQPKSRRSSGAGGSPDRKRGRWTDVKKPSPLPTNEDSIQYTSIFFETVNLHYPFLERNTFEACREVVHSSEKGVTATFNNLRRTPSIPILPPNYTLPVARFHVFMICAIGSSILSARQGQRPTAESEGYFASAMGHVENDEVKLRGSLLGLQNLLLLAMYALHVDGGGGMSIWHVNSTIVAGCIELGLHKNSVVAAPGSGKVGPTGTDSAASALKRKVFWSIYALDRNLGVMLGRPFALDENECDVDLPDTLVDDRPGVGFMDRLIPPTGNVPAVNVDESRDASLSSHFFPGTVYLLQMIRLTSLIKSTLYRISSIKPSSYPTPSWLHYLPAASHHDSIITNITEWQIAIQRYLNDLRAQAKKAAAPLQQQSETVYALSQAVELKYHEAIQLLYRPNPVITLPSESDAVACLRSTVDMIRTYSHLKTKGGMNQAWLSAQWVFLSGLSMMWSYKASWPKLLCATGSTEQKIENIKGEIKRCSGLLEDFGKRWNVMLRAKERFDEVAKLTLGILLNQGNAISMQPQNAAPSVTSGPSQATGASQNLLSPGQQYPQKHLSPSITPMPQRNLLADFQNVQLQASGTGRLQYPTLHPTQLGNQSDAQMINAFLANGITGGEGGIGSNTGADSGHERRSSQLRSDPSSMLSGASLLNQPLIPIIRQPPTPSLGPIPLEVPEMGYWILENSNQNLPQLNQQQLIGNSDNSGSGEETDFLFMPDMDWSTQDFSAIFMAAGVKSEDEQSMNPQQQHLSLGFDIGTLGGGGDDGDSKMWEMGESNSQG